MVVPSDCSVLVNIASTGLSSVHLINSRITVNMGKRKQRISMSDFCLRRNTTSGEVKGNIVCGSMFAHSMYTTKIRSIQLSFSSDISNKKFDSISEICFISAFFNHPGINYRNFKLSATSEMRVKKEFV